ncbi:MAG: hypothetical protein KKD44_25130 [Proteobacteria bacterium]|nr:hypothetical protein [Pseudomonadota bacterium]
MTHSYDKHEGRKTVMMSFLLVCDESDTLNEFERCLEGLPDISLQKVTSGQDALDLVKDKANKVDLAVVDQMVGGMPGIRWVEQMLPLNPMVNTALVSSLSDEDFHEYTEGLGVLMRIPLDPDKTTVTRVVERLVKVLSLYQTPGA